LRFTPNLTFTTCLPLTLKRLFDMGNTKIDIHKVAAAIEADTGEALPDLRQALAEANDEKGRVTTPEQMLVRQALNAA